MKKRQEKHEIDEYEEHVHLSNILLEDKSISLLIKIIDSIQYGNFHKPLRRNPSFLLVGAEGTGRELIARAIANSLALQDIRVCPSRYFDNGIYSHQFFNDSIANTAHIITDIENLHGAAEATLWKFLKNRECNYYSHADRSYSNILYCNGWIIMTCKDTELINDALLATIDYKIRLESLNNEQLKTVVHQRLSFCGIEYTGEQVLQAIVNQGQSDVRKVIDFLKICVSMLKADMGENHLTIEIVERAGRLLHTPVPPPNLKDEDSIPY